MSPLSLPELFAKIEELQADTAVTQHLHYKDFTDLPRDLRHRFVELARSVGLAEKGLDKKDADWVQLREKWLELFGSTREALAEALSSEMITVYVGFDPTADSLHLGNLMPIMALRRMQLAGHKPIALVGGSTGMVGDPGGRSEERNLLDTETLAHNVEGISAVLRRFLDFDSGAVNTAEMVNNYDWTGPVGVIDFLRDVGKHVTVNQMMAKDSVKSRLESENGISFTEFSYMTLQAADFLHLHRALGVDLQMGGADQWPVPPSRILRLALMAFPRGCGRSGLWPA